MRTWVRSDGCDTVSNPSILHRAGRPVLGRGPIREILGVMSIGRTMVAALILTPALAGVALGQEKGVTPQWDARTMLKELVGQVKRYQPLLEQLKPREWGDAAEAYTAQVESLRKEIGYLARTATELEQRPDKLTKTLEVYLRMQAVESMMDSVIDGVRRYQNPATAELLEGVVNDMGPYAQSLQDYLVQLVGMKEAEFEIADQEAQRCRAQLIGKK